MLILAKLFSFVVVGVASVQAQCARMYTVQAGDTCDTIAASNNAPTAQIITANSGTINAACSNLPVGSSICLGLTGSDCQTTYVVKAGDTCFDIAAAAGVSQDIFAGNNSPCPNIYPGEVLCSAPTSFA